jgi:hypothetical protein
MKNDDCPGCIGDEVPPPKHGMRVVRCPRCGAHRPYIRDSDLDKAATGWAGGVSMLRRCEGLLIRLLTIFLSLGLMLVLENHLSDEHLLPAIWLVGYTVAMINVEVGKSYASKGR